VPHSDRPPRLVLPDTPLAHSEVKLYCNSKGRVPGGLCWCSDYKAYGSCGINPGDPRRCDNRDPRMMLGDDGVKHNWCHRCPAGFMHENLLGADEDAYKRV